MGNRIFSYGMLFFLNITLVRCQKKIFPEISGVQVSQNFPYIMMNGDVHHYDTSNTKIYYYKNKILVSPSYFLDIFEGEKILKTELIWYYFVFEKNSKEGYLSNKSKNLFNVKCPVDSFLSKQFPFNNHTQLLNKLDSKFLYEKEKESVTYKTYSIQNGDKDSLGKLYTDTLILGFNEKMDDSKFSFSEQLDSIHKKKLISLTIKASPKYYKEKKFFYNSHIELYFFDKIEVQNKEELMKYFNFKENKTKPEQ